MANLRNNTTTIQSILKTVNTLPNAGGGGVTPTGTKYITKNGTYNVANYAEANVNVPSTIPASYADVSGVTATTADVLSTAKFVPKEGGNPVSGTIPTKSNNDLTPSGATITGPAGYYSSGISKSVATTTKATPTISKTSTGKLKASYTQSAGYVTSGTVDSNEVSASSLDSNLTENNIKNGVTIFGVQGKYTGANGRIGDLVRGSFTSTKLTFNVDTENLIGFYFTADDFSIENDGTLWTIVTGGFYLRSVDRVFLDTIYKANSASEGLISGYLYYSNATVSISTGTIVISLPGDPRFSDDSNTLYFIQPIYSK